MVTNANCMSDVLDVFGAGGELDAPNIGTFLLAEKYCAALWHIRGGQHTVQGLFLPYSVPATVGVQRIRGIHFSHTIPGL